MQKFEIDSVFKNKINADRFRILTVKHAGKRLLAFCFKTTKKQ